MTEAMGGNGNSHDTQEYHQSPDTDDETRLPAVTRRSLLGGLAVGAAGAIASDSESDLLIGAASASEVGGDHEAVLNLVPTDEATHTATTSGAWSQASTWDDGRPGDGARVHVPEGRTVTVDDEIAARIHWVRVDGTLRFATDTDTHLRVDTIVTTEGSRFEIGTENDPIQGDVTAQITFIDRGALDENWDPQRVSRGLMTMGVVRTEGQDVLPFTELSAHAEAGDTSIDLSESPEGWQAGDQLVVPSLTHSPNHDEERTVTGVSGRTVQLDEPLEYDHVPPRDDLPTYVANLTRNIRLESENTATKRRGHVMFMDQDVEFRNVGLYELGRTDKSLPISNPMFGEQVFEETWGETGNYGYDLPGKEVQDSEYTLEEYLADPGPNPAARYSVHFHRTGIDESQGYPQAVDTDAKPGLVENCVAWGSPGWGYVNHYSYAHFRDNVSYDVFGAHYNCEAGTEMGSFEHNIAIRAEGDEGRRSKGKRKDIGDWGHNGQGFWMQAVGVELEGNVVCGVNSQAYAWWGLPLPHSDEKDWSGVNDDDNRGRDLREGYVSYPVAEANPRARFPRPGKGSPADEEFVRTRRVQPPKFKDNVAIGAFSGFFAWRQQYDIYGTVPYHEMFHADGFVGYHLEYYLEHDYTNNLRYSDCYVAATGSFGGTGRTGTREIHENCTYVGFDSEYYGPNLDRGTAFRKTGRLYGCELDGDDEDMIARTVFVSNTKFDTVRLDDRDGELVELEDSTDPEELAEVENVHAFANDTRIGAGFEDGDLSGPLTVKSHEHAAGDQYVTHENHDYEQFPADILEGRPTEIEAEPDEVNASVTLEDVPDGEYDVWVRYVGFVDRSSSNPKMRYRIDDGEWSTSGNMSPCGTFEWGKLTSNVSLSGDVDISVANSGTGVYENGPPAIRAWDAVLLVGSGPNPQGPLRLEAKRGDESEDVTPSVSMSDQTSDGQTVTVNSAANPEDFAVVMHKGGEGGPKIGSKTLSGGRNSTITIELEESLSAGEHTLVPMLHEAADGGHGPPITRDGEMVTDTATVTVEESGNCVVEHFAGEDGDVSDIEMLRALRQWRDDEPVEECGRQVRYTDLLELIARWRDT